MHGLGHGLRFLLSGDGARDLFQPETRNVVVTEVSFGSHVDHKCLSGKQK